MRSSRKFQRVFGVLVAVFAAVRVSGSESPEDKLEEALYREMALADPEGALRAYREIVADASAPSRVLALAHLRLGICLKLRGEEEEGRRHIQTVVEKYPLEEAAVTAARELLDRGTRADPARFVAPGALLYLEVVEPAAHTAHISELLEGTPFRNPVDYYVSYLSGRQGGAGLSDPEPAAQGISPAAAFLNQGFLAEIGKIGGFAVSIPSDRRTNKDFLAVFFPGKSDILRGLVQMLLTLVKAEAAGAVEGRALLRVPPQGSGTAGVPTEDWVHFALGPEAIVFGRPRRLVEEALKREAGGGECLASDPDFLRARAARAGSFVFSYVAWPQALKAMAAEMPQENREAFEAVRAILALDEWESVSFTAAYSESGDTLRFTFRAKAAPGARGPLAAFQSPQLSPEILRGVPEGTAAFFAMSFADEHAKREVAHAFATLASRRAGDEAARLGKLASETWWDFYLSLESLVVGVTADFPIPTLLASFAVLRFRDPERGAEKLEAFVVEACQTIFRNAASERFSDEEISAGGKRFSARAIEPIPGLRLRYVRLGDFLAVSFLESQLETMASAYTQGSPWKIPPKVHKVFYVSPRRLLASWDGLVAPELKKFLQEIPEAFVVTREARESLSLDLVLPSAVPAVRRILSKISQGER